MNDPTVAYTWHYYARRQPGTLRPAVYMGEIDGPNVSRVAEYRWMWRARIGAAARNLVAFGEADVSQEARYNNDWLVPFDGSGREWHESLPSPYIYQGSDFNKLVAAVHEYEAEVQALRDALHRCRADYHAKVLALQAEKASRG